jgi:hypothetical protein
MQQTFSFAGSLLHGCSNGFRSSRNKNKSVCESLSERSYVARKMIRALASCAALAAVASAGTSDDCFGYGCATADLSVGSLRGNVWAVGEEYLAIPFASAKRFAAPTLNTKLTPDNTTFDATNILGQGQAACAQGGYLPHQKQYGVEDCLIINMYKPPGNTPSAPRPILIWVFGGDNTASEIIPYNATMLAGWAAVYYPSVC